MGCAPQGCPGGVWKPPQKGLEGSLGERPPRRGGWQLPGATQKPPRDVYNPPRTPQNRICGVTPPQRAPPAPLILSSPSKPPRPPQPEQPPPAEPAPSSSAPGGPEEPPQVPGVPEEGSVAPPRAGGAELLGVLLLLRRKLKVLQQRRRRHRARLQAMEGLLRHLRPRDAAPLLQEACLPPAPPGAVTIICGEAEDALLYALPPPGTAGTALPPPGALGTPGDLAPQQP
ncbi:hypothetical protein LUU34_01623900 [Aix galericulata]|nr:hypothetical protein LUU34_01623900 [Aix galericulata]